MVDGLEHVVGRLFSRNRAACVRSRAYNTIPPRWNRARSSKSWLSTMSVGVWRLLSCVEIVGGDWSTIR